MTKINYLVFSGGGAAGYAFAGAIDQLGQEKAFSFDEIKATAGTSIGAIAALMVSLNYTPQETRNKLAKLDLQKFQDGGFFFSRVYRTFTRYGQYTGSYLYEFIKDILQTKTGRRDPENVTFADLKKLGFKDLYVVTTKLYKENNIPTAKEKIFSYNNTPDTPVASVVLASSSAPLYFMRVRLKKVAKGKYLLSEEGNVFDDGGLLNNFPIDIFDKPRFMGLPDDGLTRKVNPTTLGFALRRTEQLNDKHHKPVKTPILDNRPFEFARGVLTSFTLQYAKSKLEKSENRQRTVQIDRLDVSLNDFDISEETKISLMDSGKKAVEDYFRDLKPQATSTSTQPMAFNEKKVKLGLLWEHTKRIACNEGTLLNDSSIEELAKCKS